MTLQTRPGESPAGRYPPLGFWVLGQRLRADKLGADPRQSQGQNTAGPTDSRMQSCVEGMPG
jgi:hypothetical protein